MPLAPEIRAEGFQIEEITVTARKRDESLQEVPESVTVLSESLISDAGIDNLQGIADLAPNIHLNDSFSKATVRLNVRGIGTPQFGEAPVSFVVDGATVPDINFINQGIFDVESIQLLRGPQGALYGQGALVGAIIIQSKTPSNDLSGNFEVKYESGSDKTINAAMSGAIIDDVLLYRIGATYNDREGQIKNVEGEHVDFVDGSYGVRGALTWMPNDAIDMTFTAKIADGDYGYGIQYRIPEAELNDSDSYEVAQSNYPGLERQESEEFTFQLNWDFGFASLTAVTNYSDIDDILWLEQDARPTASQIQIPWNRTEGFSQEVRLTSADDQRFRWIVGGAYRDRTNTYLYGRLADPGDDSRPDWYVGHPNQRDHAVTDSTDFGVFVYGSYDLTDELELTAALRYDKTERDQKYDYELPTPVEGERSVEFSEVQPKLGLSYQMTPDTLMYASYSRGFRTGGLNNPAYGIQPNFYDEEISDSYEIGAKSTLWDNRLIVNGAVYYMDIENYQFSEFATTIGNANLADTPIQGFEIEVMAKATENLTLNMAYGYTDAEVVRFGETPDPRKDGNEVPFVPRYTFNISATHSVDLDNGAELRSYVAYRRSGATYHRSDNRNKIDAQHYVDAKVSLNMENWSIAAYVDNVMDYRSAIHFFSTSEPVVTPNQPRSYGISVRYDI
nr:TonB-dependent receptor [Pseudomaricurvus alkylphenolicus]